MLSKVWDWTTARVLCTSLIFAAVIAFLYSALKTLTLFLFAILFAYFVEPLVGRLERPLHGRIKAIAVVYATLLGVLVGLGLFVGPRVVEEGRDYQRCKYYAGQFISGPRSFFLA